MARREVQQRDLRKIPAKFVHARSLRWDTLKTICNMHPKFAIVLPVIRELIIRNERDCPFIRYPVERGPISENLEICLNRMTSDLINNNLPRPMYIQMPKYHSPSFAESQRRLVIPAMHTEKKQQCLRSRHVWKCRSEYKKVQNHTAAHHR